MTSPTAARDILKSVFGFADFKLGQQDIIDHLLAGDNVLAVMPTGSGKSLCYQVPGIILDRLTVVISPLVALMDDQVNALQSLGVAAECIHSGKTRDANINAWRTVQSGACAILYLSPERLMTERMLAAIVNLAPAMFVVDEAHCISKWGSNFRPEYEQLSALKDRFPDATLAAFTATADEATRRDIAAKLFSGHGKIIVHGFDRPNLYLAVAPKTTWKKQLLAFVDSRRGQPGVVYCLSRRLTEEVSEFLNHNNIRALPYHAGLGPEQRRENQEIFMAEDGVVMVATIAFGMGIDKPDIRYVFHTNLPSSMEAYYQEIGRAGRDGAPADVSLIYGLDDIRMRRRFIDEDGAEQAHKFREHKRLDALLAYCEATECRRVTLLSYFDEATQPCGNCDNCLYPPTVIDATDAAQDLFNVAIATGQAFGAAHLIDVVRGTKTAKVEERNHDALPHFGTGAQHSKPYWQGFIRQAVAGGFMYIDIENYGRLRLTKRAEHVLAGAERFSMREETEADLKAATSRAAKSAKKPARELNAEDNDLFAELKNLRRHLAKERNVPAYVIFPDATLSEMAANRPSTLQALAAINGVGPKKLDQYGEMFLQAISAVHG